MFKNLFDFGYIRTTKEAFGFYLAYLFLLILGSGLLGGVGAVVTGATEDEAYAVGIRIGSAIAVLSSVVLSFTILAKKALLGEYRYVILAISSGIIALLIGGLGGLIPVAFLTTRKGGTSALFSALTINLEGVMDKASLFKRLDEVLITKEWGHNWDALYDCLHDLSTGGFTEQYEFPLTLEVTNWQDFREASGDDFASFKKVLEDQVESHKGEGRTLTVHYTG